jgi:hypothetical protein
MNSKLTAKSDLVDQLQLTLFAADYESTFDTDDARRPGKLSQNVRALLH